MHRSRTVLACGLQALRAAVLEVLAEQAAFPPTLGRPALAGAGSTLDVRGPGIAWAEVLDAESARAAGSAAAGTSSGNSSGTAPAARRDAPAGSPPHVVDLVDRARAGDPEAFGLLYDHYVDTVYRYVLYRVGTVVLAEDLTSETFLRALRRVGTFTWQGRDFGAWLVTIARNLIADHFKSGRFRLEVAIGDMVDADRAEDGPENAVLATLANATLLEAVKKLSPEQQECIVLRFLQGMSVAETAQIMGKNDGAVKTLQYRAVRALARHVPRDLR